VCGCGKGGAIHRSSPLLYFLAFPGATTGTFNTTVVAGCVFAYPGVTIRPVFALIGMDLVAGFVAIFEAPLVAKSYMAGHNSP
jgi:hypothetical protein